MKLKVSTSINYPQISSRSQKSFKTTLFIFILFFEVLINHLLLANLNQKLPEPQNLRVVQQRTAPDNFNIGVIHVKLKNWTTTTRFPRTSNKLHFILNDTEQQQKRRRNYEVGESRGRRTDGSQPNQASNGGGGSGGMEMEALFPYLLLALGLALVAFFVILYAILNALLQRKDQHESVEQRRRRRKKRKRRRKRDWRNDSNDLIEGGKHFGDDEENSSEEKHLDSLDEGSNDLAHPPLMGVRPVARWHRSRDGPLDEELMERNDSDWMMSGGSGMRRYRQHRASGNRRAPPPPLPHLPPPPHEPPRSRQLSQQHYPQHYTRGQRHIGWANEDQISLPGILRSTPRPPPPPPPRAPPPPPPLPARYQKRSRRQPHEPSIENSSDENDDQSSDGGNRRHRVYHKKRHDDQKRNNPPPIPPPQPLRRENTDSTVSSLQRGGRAGSL
uniref:Uncharacterized protein n=1 Tax=Meloidogyne enterolobii TaxID=390850 RepID=A0A6V7TUD6_MELEN|nr:unnamed protein product [Meloidogyne enterolobii]